MDEIEEANDDIDICKFAFTGSNKETFIFNTFRMPLNFLSAIYNGEISLIKAEFEQGEIEKKQKSYSLTMNQKRKKKKKIQMEY